MLAVDFDYYRDVYRGEAVGAEAWPAFSRDAAAWLDAVTFSRADERLPPETLDACKMAVCAAAEVLFRQREGGALTSETVGKWSRSYAADTRPCGKKLRDAAALYLASTGLLYRGVTP